MKNEMTFGGAEHYRVLSLIEDLQREGKTEAEISSAVRDATEGRHNSAGRA